MTISSTIRKAGPFSGTGAQTVYPFAFKVFTASDMYVVLTDAAGIETTQTLTTNYTVALNADQNVSPGGSITMLAAPPIGYLLTVGSVVQPTQGQSIPNMGGFYPKVIENALDKLTISVQQIAESAARSFKLAFSDTGSANLPAAAARANKLLSFDANGNPVAVAATSGSATALQLLLASAVGAAMIGYSADGSARTLKQMLDLLYFGVVNVNDVRFAGGARGDGVTDDYAALQAAYNFAGQTGRGGTVFHPSPRYKSSQMLTVPLTGAGISLEGLGGFDQSTDNGTTVIYGAHTQDAIISLQGAVGCQISKLCLDGGTGATFPKTGLLLGRNGAGSAGWHSFHKMGITGRYSVAGLYNVASEGNSYNDLFINLDAGSTATKAVYLSGADSGGLAPVTALTGSTLLGAEFINCSIYHMSLTAGISCVYIDGSAALGSIAFRGGYLVQANGHFVSIRNGTVDGNDTLGPITFDGVGGERPGGVGVPISGFNLFASLGAPVYLRGLSIRNCRFLMAAGYYVKQDAYVKLANAVILSQGVDATIPAALVNRPSQIGTQRFGLAAVNNGECLDCLIDVGGGFKVEGTNQAVLLGAWVQVFSLGNGYGIVGYYKDLTGHVHLTGAPNGGASGTVVFTLPVGYRPTTNKMFTVTSNTSTIAGQGDTTVLVETAGNVTITGGTVPCYLSGVVFPSFA